MDSQEILAMADERFERRLAEESATIREEISAIRQDIAVLRGDMATRKDLNDLRQDMSAGFSRIERGLANTRVDMIKWSFMFWTGQSLAILGFLFVFLRNR